MRAASYSQYGGPKVIKIKDLEKPKPDANELLVKIHATTVSSGDWRARSLNMPAGYGLLGRLVFGLFGPRQKVLGSEYAGVVEAIGAQVDKFKVGDKVFAYPGASLGGHADYATISQTAAVSLMANDQTYHEAAAMSFGGVTAIYFLEQRAKIQAGESVLIVGASGCVGMAVLQLAKHAGAVTTAVCSTNNVELMYMQGADAVLDYTAGQLRRHVQQYDIIIDTQGADSYANYQRLLKPKGRVALVAADLYQQLAMLLTYKTHSQQGISGYAAANQAALGRLKQLYETGVYRPHVDRVYRFEDICDAHSYVDTGRKRGNVVVKMR